MAGFANKCPKCRTAIKIRSADMVGKKARCPKCSTVFRIKAPPRAKATAAPRPDSEEFAFFDDLTDEDLAERESTGESSDELGEFDDDVSSEDESNERSKSKENRNSKKPVNTDLMIGGIVIGVGMILLAIVGYVGWQVAPDIIASGTSAMSWMPDDTETVWEVRPDPFWTSRAMNGITKTKLGTPVKKLVEGLIAPIAISDLDHITIGIPPSSSENPEAVIALYSNSAFDVSALQAARPGFVEMKHGKESYYLDSAQNRAAYFPRSDVLVYATEAHLKSTIDAGGVSAAATNFSLPYLETINYATTNPNGFGHQVVDYLAGHPLNSRPDSQGLLAMSVGVEAAFDFYVETQLTYESAERAAAVVEQMNADVQTLISEMEYERDERLKNDYPFKMDVGGARRFYTRQTDALKSFDASSSGAEVYVEFTASNFFPEFGFSDMEVDEFQGVLGIDLGG